MNALPSLLIVDDEVDSCQNLADIFTDLGYRVDTAHDGNAALVKLKNSRYDIALLDFMMPGMDGVTLCLEMRRHRPEIVAVLTTAYPNHPRAEESLKSGMWRIVPKPVDLSRLFKLLDEAAKLPAVLLVDDDTDLCANLCDLLWEKGFRVSIAHDIQTATALLRDDGFNVVLIDMRLSDGDGAEVFRLSREMESKARTILITGYRVEQFTAIEKMKEQGADAVCFKPFDVPTLLETVERLGRSCR